MKRLDKSTGEYAFNLRGERSNWVSRKWFKKKALHKELTKKEMAKIENIINNAPSRVLSFYTPNETFKYLRDQIISPA